MKILHLSDLHFPVYGENKHFILIEFLLEEYRFDKEKPVVIISGDLIENPNKPERLDATYDHFNQLKEAGFTLLICPGNHDLKYLGAAGFVGDNRKQFNQKLKQLIPSESIWYGTDLDSYPIIHKIESTFFIGLDSLEDEKDLAADGELGVTQLSILDDKLTEIRSNYQGSQIIVYLHHQPFEIMLGEFWMKLKDRKRFMEIINGVDCLLFGHVHIQKRFELEEKLHHIKCIHLSGATLDNEYGIIVTEIDTKDFNINYTVVPVPEKDKD